MVCEYPVLQGKRSSIRAVNDTDHFQAWTFGFIVRKRRPAAFAETTSSTQKAGIPMRFTFFSPSRNFLAVPFVALACLQAFAQQAPVASPGESVQLDHVGLVIGMPDLLPNLHGTLNITSKTLSFSTPKASAGIERATITKVAVGEEAVETGGMTGSIARKVLPYGSGAALGTVTHKKVGLLSAEFRDSNNEYHGVVFVLQLKDVAAVQQALGGGITTVDAPAASVPAACPADQVKKDTVRLAPIQVEDSSLLPEEYRVLVYEYLIKQLKSEKDLQAVYRDGDRNPAAQCAEFSLTLQLKTFKKGNQIVRASTGPLGAFFGTTSLSYHLTAKTLDGTSVIDKDMKSSERKDTDNLNVTKMMSKSIVKDLRKTEKQLRKIQVGKTGSPKSTEMTATTDGALPLRKG